MTLIALASFSLTSLVPLIITLVVLGVVLWLVDSQLPIAEPFKTLIRVIVVLAVCLWLLRFIGLV